MINKNYTVEQVLKLYDERTAASEREQALESQIFDASRTYSKMEIKNISDSYRILKDERCEISIESAVAFMSLSKEDKMTVNHEYAKNIDSTITSDEAELVEETSSKLEQNDE